MVYSDNSDDIYNIMSQNSCGIWIMPALVPLSVHCLHCFGRSLPLPWPVRAACWYYARPVGIISGPALCSVACQLWATHRRLGLEILDPPRVLLLAGKSTGWLPGYPWACLQAIRLSGTGDWGTCVQIGPRSCMSASAGPATRWSSLLPAVDAQDTAKSGWQITDHRLVIGWRTRRYFSLAEKFGRESL